jgi:polyisoprenoid-binding protein YceI
MSTSILRLLAASLLVCTLNVQGAERYVIDSQHSFSIFEYKHWGLSLQQGRFDKNVGSITLDKEAKTGSISLEIDATSVSTGTDVFNTTLRSSSFFDVEKFPIITYQSSALRFNDEGKLTQVEGDLTIKGVTRATTLEITQFNCRFMPLYFKTACGANGFAKILRSDFGVGKYVPFVSDEVTLYFAVEAIKE